jgi:uncharacterized protein YkwD
MNVSRALRPALRALTATLVTAVTVTGFSSAPTVSVAVAPGPSDSTAVTNIAVQASPGYSTTYYERNVQAWVNQVRRQHGRKPLTLAACADTSAERWAARLATRDAFYHQSMNALLRRCDARYAGETLGRGSITPRRLVQMWMQSPPHRKILLSAGPRRIGIGAVPNSRGEWVVAANFLRF